METIGDFWGHKGPYVSNCLQLGIFKVELNSPAKMSKFPLINQEKIEVALLVIMGTNVALWILLSPYVDIWRQKET